jgi:hypothetical protein
MRKAPRKRTAAAEWDECTDSQVFLQMTCRN